MPATPANPAYVAGLTVEQLVEMCNNGNVEACHELDRRGVEPSMVQTDTPPVANFDIATERHPNPVFLRAWAGSIKGEASILAGQVTDRVLDARTSGQDVADEFDLAGQTAVAAGVLFAAVDHLERLADALDEADARHRRTRAAE